MIIKHTRINLLVVYRRIRLPLFLVMLTQHAKQYSPGRIQILRPGLEAIPGHSLPLLYTDLCLLQPWSKAFFSVLRALRKCSCHDRDSPSMLDPPPMIEFLGLHACSVRIKGRHALKWGTCSNSNTEQQYSIQWQNREQALVSS